MAFMGMASLGKMTFLKEHGLRSKAHQLMEHHVLPWAPNTFKYLGQKPCVGRDLPGRVPSNSAAPQTLAEKIRTRTKM